MITRRTFTAMLAGLPLFAGFRLPGRPRTEDVCSNCGDYPKISRDDPNAFSANFGDMTGAYAHRYVIEEVRLGGQLQELNSIRDCVAGCNGWVAILIRGSIKAGGFIARHCGQCGLGPVWRIHYGHVEVKYHRSTNGNTKDI